VGSKDDWRYHKSTFSLLKGKWPRITAGIRRRFDAHLKTIGRCEEIGLQYLNVARC